MKKTTYFLLLLPVLFSCGSHPEEKQTPVDTAIRVKLAPVQQQAYARPVVTSGSITSDKESRLSFKTTGFISRLFVQEGDPVSRGQVLAALDQTEVRAMLIQSRSEYAKNSRDYNRLLSLYRDSTATLEELENARTRLDLAQQQLNVNRFNQQHATIYANQSGRVTHKWVSEGELTPGGTAIYTISSTNEQDWVIRIGVTDKDWIRIKVGDRATIQIDAYPNKPFIAVVAQLGQTADPVSGTFLVKLKLNVDHRRVASGMAAKVQIHPSVNQPVTFVPIEALTEIDGQTGSVYSLAPNGKSVARHGVHIAFVAGNRAAIDRGLSNIKSVVTEGTSYLSEATAVRVIR